jgi:hypothetical protein
MTGSPHITLRRTGLALVAAIMAAAFAGSALAADDRPAASFYTPQALKAMSANWAAKGRLLGSPDAASFYTREQLQAMSSNWAAKGRLLGNTDWTANVLREAPPAASGSSGKFKWSDFGMGAGAMLGAVMLAAGLGAAFHYGRRGGVRTRPV